ncbi:Oidioi.mRNA.OKI2018_I69.PAR.g9770.t1.cds [Oikopleura dioica]|nr:Oidioi.mRNA.OKI2018_I69.PAR.g9770.t1.cds [Oikopleura dioica]
MKKDVGSAADSFVTYLESRRAMNISLNAVYLASPPQEKEIHGAIRNALKKRYTKEEVKFLDADDLDPYYDSLKDIPEGLRGDITSSIEQEVCLRARIFLERIK